MIFVILGSQKFQFNRLLKYIDELIETKKITEDVFAQIGYSDYKPKYYEYKKFLNNDEFQNYIEKSNVIITHAGTGSIINAIKKEKKVIAVPRLVQYGEHVDNHQIEIIRQFAEMHFIVPCYNINDLEDKLSSISNINLKKYISNTETIINDIKNYLEEI